MRTQWNTGRQYTQYGQRMTAIRLEGDIVLFRDKDRMIEGKISRPIPDFVKDEKGLQWFVDDAYLHCQYEYSELLWEHRKELEWKVEA